MIVGIDFGTTNSSVAGVWAGATEPVAFQVSSGREPYNTLLRTAVLDPFGRADGTVIGEEAEKRAVLRIHKGRLIRDFKRRLAKQRLREDVPVTEYKRGEYDYREESDRLIPVRTHYKWIYDEYYLSDVVQSAACILRALLKAASAEADSRKDNLEQIICGLPVSYDALLRRRLLHAFLETGLFQDGHQLLQKVRFFYEPVAVAFAYGVHHEAGSRVLVFDYGAGTLDLAVVGFERNSRGEVLPSREVALGGHAGAGNRMDKLFQDYILERFAHIREEHDRLDEVGLFQAGGEIERAKIRLSKSNRTMLQYGSRQIEVTRAEFEQAVRPELEEIGRSFDQLLESYRLEPGDIDLVVLAGGSSLLSIVHETVERLVPHLPPEQIRKAWAGDLQSEELAMTAVAKGLAVYGRQRQFKRLVPFSLQVWSPKTRSFHTVVKKGEEFEPGGLATLAEVPFVGAFEGGSCPQSVKLPKFRVTVPVEPVHGHVSIGVWEDIHGGKYLFGLVDLPCSGGSVDVEVVLTDSILPEISVWTDERAEPFTVQLSSHSPNEIERMLRYDAEWLPLRRKGDRPVREYTCLLTKPLEKGDYVVWLDERSRAKMSGRVTGITTISDGKACERMDCWDTKKYVFTVVSERRRGNGPGFRITPGSDSIRLLQPRID